MTKLPPRSKAKKAARPRVLVVAHNHPDFFPGGAEILAHRLFQRFRADGLEAFFLAATGSVSRVPHPSGPLFAKRDAPGEWLLWGEPFDYFLQSHRAPYALHTHLARLLNALQPDVVHVHHTLRVGMEALHVIKRTLPSAKLVYTLHDFIPLCHRDGQMVRNVDETLCDRASPKRCHECFPDISASQFKLRELWMKRHLAEVDAFIAPSCFLAERYIAWGIDAHKMHIIRNGHLDAAKQKTGKRPCRAAPVRIGYIGQITPYKGAMLLLDAARRLDKQKVQYALHLHGNIAMQQELFQQQFHAALKQAGETVTFHGRYAPADLPGILQSLDWVVVPSTWWENAPLVIDEAFNHGVPVICSDIGGMAEKVAHEKNGLHFKVGDAKALAETLRRALTEKGLRQALAAGIAPPPGLAECAAAHEALYAALRASS